MPKNRLRIIVEGDTRDRGHVRLSDFLNQLNAVKAALRQTERIIGGEDAGVYYRIVDVSHRSPLTVVLEGVAEKDTSAPPPVVLNTFIGTLSAIRRRGTIPQGFDYLAAESYREIVAPQHKHVRSLVIANTRKRVRVDARYEERIKTAIGPDEYAEGSVTGTLDTVKLHNTTAFEIFPTIGPKKIACYFPPQLKQSVKEGLDRYVRVYGRLRYKHWDKFPYAIDVHEIEIYPPEEELPTLTELRGIAPQLTGGLEPREFLDKVRSGWQT